MKIRLMQTPDVDPMAWEHLQRHLGPVFSGEVEVGGNFLLRPEDFDPDRLQYRSSAILERLGRHRAAGELLLAITGADLFAPGLNFVFGEANPDNHCALISLARLRATYPGQTLTTKLFRHRVLTEAVHEVGHLLGLGHCPRTACAMHFSNSLSDTDRKKAELCPDCRKTPP